MKRTISVVICGLVVLSSLLFATGCGRSTHEVDLSKYVKFDGFSSMAKLNSTPDYEKCEDERDEIAEKRSDIKDKDDSKYKEYSDKIAELTDTKNALKNITFSLSKGENGKIKNGDTITVKAKYKEDKLKNFGIDLKSDEFSFKVSGLEEKEVIDPFDKDHFELKASGLDGKGKVDNGVDDSTSIYYTFEPSYNLKNGDKVTVTATMYDDDAVLKDSTDEDGTKAEKEFTVSGLGTIPETLDGVDTSYVDGEFLKGIKDEVDIKKNDTLQGYELGIDNKNYEFSDLKITSLDDYKRLNGIYGYKDKGDSKDCKYGVVYTRDVTVKVVDPGYSSKVKKGSTKKFTIYYIGYESGSNLMVTDDKKLDRRSYDYSLYYSVGKSDTYKGAEDKMTKYSSQYTYSEVK